MCAVASYAAIDRDAGDVVGAHRFHQRLMQRLILPLIFFADINPHQFGVALDLQVQTELGLF